MLDLGPAAWQLAALIGSTPDAMLRAPTPCPAWTLGDLVHHAGILALAFAAAAGKVDDESLAGPAPEPSGDALPGDWRTAIPRAVNALAEAWRDPDAWSGTTRVGGIGLPGEVAGVFALDEVVLHGWDIARALGRPYNCDETSLHAVDGLLSQLATPGQEAMRSGLFAPTVHVAPDAPLLHRIVAKAGRDPLWNPAI